MITALIVSLFVGPAAYPQAWGTLETKDLVVHYPAGMEKDARETAQIYPSAASQVSARIGMGLDLTPEVVLVANREIFEQITRSRIIVAYAVPARMLVVIDHPRAGTGPGGLKGILVHELCHLALHRHMDTLPRWFEEGICMEASEGAAELFSDRGGPSMSWLALVGDLPSLSSLDSGFPGDDHGLRIAYAMSRSMVDFITRRYGKDAPRTILVGISSGMSFEDATRAALGAGVREIEMKWRKSLVSWGSILGLVASNLTEIVFFLGAIGAAAAFARYRARKRSLAELDDTETTCPPEHE